MTPAHAQQGIYASIVMDAQTEEVYHDDLSDERRYPASLTKMMTLYLVFDALESGELSMDTRLTASRNASRQPPSRLGLRRGNTITVEQAIYALVVNSANDVATMVAERLGGTEARFAAQMTSRARGLGMTQTHFANASGLPNTANYSTARDMAILSLALWRNHSQYYHYFQTPEFRWGRAYSRNHNRLLGAVEGVDGLKTGYIRVSGFNLAVMAERDSRRIVVVVMGGRTSDSRDEQVTYLIESTYALINTLSTIEEETEALEGIY